MSYFAKSNVAHFAMSKRSDESYFDLKTLEVIEALTLEDSGAEEKDRLLLIGIMEHLENKHFISRSQKWNVHRVVEKYVEIVKEPGMKNELTASTTLLLLSHKFWYSDAGYPPPSSLELFRTGMPRQDRHYRMGAG